MEMILTRQSIKIIIETILTTKGIIIKHIYLIMFLHFIEHKK